MKTKLILVIDRDPAELIDLAELTQLCREDASHIAWLLEVPVLKVDIKAVKDP